MFLTLSLSIINNQVKTFILFEHLESQIQTKGLEVAGAYKIGDRMKLRRSDWYPRCNPKSHLLILKLVNSG
jgi:hypothetical protein